MSSEAVPAVQPDQAPKEELDGHEKLVHQERDKMRKEIYDLRSDPKCSEEMRQIAQAMEYMLDGETALQKAYRAQVHNLKLQLHWEREENARLNAKLDEAKLFLESALTRLEVATEKIENKAKD